MNFFCIPTTTLFRDGVILLVKLLLRILCGRYSAAGTLDEFAEMIGCSLRMPFFAPRQQAPVFVLESNQPVMKLMRWGLIPGRAKDESIGDNLINDRAETIAEKPASKSRLNPSGVWWQPCW